MTCEQEAFLNDSWCVYFHEPENEAWDDASYHMVANIATASQVHGVCNAFNELWSKGMFFVMREHIKPMWEDECNKNGGCFSFKVMKSEVPGAWKQLMMMATGETLVKEEYRAEHWDKVCGISISPKRNYCILRVWISDKEMSNLKHYKLCGPSYTTILFKEHAP